MTQGNFLVQLLERLSPEEALVWEALQEHRGKDQAITNQQLADLVGLPERLVRWCLKSLTEDHRKPIGSLPGLGVFIVTDLKERQEVVDFYRGHALSLLRRMCILSHHNTKYLIGQLELQLRELLEREDSRGEKQDGEEAGGDHG